MPDFLQTTKTQSACVAQDGAALRWPAFLISGCDAGPGQQQDITATILFCRTSTQHAAYFPLINSVTMAFAALVTLPSVAVIF